MKVINRGTPPESLNYRTSCDKCHSLLEFKKSEAQVKSDRNETINVVNCLVCRNDIWITSQALNSMVHRDQ